MHVFLASLSFLSVSGILFFLPGFLLLRAFFGKRRPFFPFETFLFSFGLSIGLLDFVMILLGKSGIVFNTATLSLGLAATVAILVLGGSTSKYLKFLPLPLSKGETEKGSENETPENSFAFSKHQNLLFITLIALTILVKTVYMSHAVLPTATDLGHHMYWSKLIAETGKLPIYAKQEIETGTDGTYRITEPQPIADFIIGEHLPFAAVNIFAKTDFFSAFPAVFLLFINLLSLLALFMLALRLASGIRIPFLSEKIFTPQNVALATLFFFGPLYALASPQAKFVSGGVVGNTFGNLFIPLIILAYCRALQEKRSGFLALGFFLTFALAYIHHLSALMLLFALVASALVYLAFHSDALAETLYSWWKLLFSPGSILVALFAIAFFFMVAMPTYIETHAVGTAIGTPTKATRTGLSFLQTASSNGEARVALGVAGLAILLAIAEARKRYTGAFLLGWSIVLLVMTMRPHWLFIDIPSNRIVTYLSFPLGTLAAFALVALFAALFSSPQGEISLTSSPAKGGPPAGGEEGSKNALRIPSILFLFIGFATFAFASGSGSFDNSQTLLPRSKALDALQTFNASRYLADNSRPQDIILKDHNYIAADSWMKLFFMRDYSYPLSRGFFKRYEDNPDREQCTLAMISTPNLPQGKKCYDETNTGLIVVNPRLDTAQFEKSERFSRIYMSDMVAIYKRK